MFIAPGLERARTWIGTRPHPRGVQYRFADSEVDALVEWFCAKGFLEETCRPTGWGEFPLD